MTKSVLTTARGIRSRKYPDDKTYKQYRNWVQHRNQAMFRKEEYNLTFDEYKAFWDKDERWDNKGRKRCQFQMKRTFPMIPWGNDNIELHLVKGSFTECKDEN